MTTSLRPHNHSTLQQWDHTRRPRSQPAPEYQDASRESHHSPNRVKAKPASPAVINSIIDSLDTLASPPPPVATEQPPSPSETRSKRPRPYSADGTVRSLPSRVRSDSSSVSGREDTRAAAAHDEVAEVDAAVAPTIRTSRAPSGLSTYNAPRTPSFSGSGEKTHRSTSSSRSHRSSFSSTTKEKPRERSSASKNKLSAESWVKRNSASRESIERKASSESRRSLRRKNSGDTLRPPKTRIELVPPATEPPFVSRAEQIIAKVSTPSSSSTPKRRLYLTDSGSAEEQAFPESPAPIQEAPELEQAPEPPSALAEDKPAEDTVHELPSSRRSSPQKNAIADSIPMRTSSLRVSHSSSPGPGKKKEKKSKRKSEATRDTNSKPESKVDSIMESNPKNIPESSWADLGEADETVKRIRELQERRRSRLMDMTLSPSPEATPPPPPPPAATRLASNGTTPVRKSGDVMREPRSSMSRSSMDKARKVLGMPKDMDISPLHGGRTGRHKLSLDERKLQIRPSTSNSTPSPPLSLDYSYAEAVDALHGVQRDLRPRTPEVPRAPAVQTPETESPLDRTLSTRSTPAQRQTTKSSFRKLEKRWTAHPDVPTDSEKKKSRRKSTSDARHYRVPSEPEPPVPRRDSTEIAVIEYLQQPRLSRRIKHPLTGRVISFSEVGDPQGAAVFVCLGMGLTRYVSAFYDELATTLRLRLITIDRPGVGNSEPYPPSDRSGPLSWPDDVLAVSQHLGVTHFSMLAHSAGAIYALATALILPHLIRGKIHLLAPWIPPSQLEAISHPAASAPPAGALPKSQQILRVLPTSFLKAANSSFLTATSASLKPGAKRKASDGKTTTRTPDPPPSRGQDRPVTREGRRPEHERRESLMHMDQFMPDLNPMENFPIPVTEDDPSTPSIMPLSATVSPSDPNTEYATTALHAAEHTEREKRDQYTSRLTQRTWELAVRDSNPATDLLVCLERHRDVGFRYTDVNRDVVITHGAEDRRVPVANVRWLADQMNRKAENHREHKRGGFRPESRLPPSREGWDQDGDGGCEVRVLEGEGHGLMASPLIMGDVLTEIAGYWSGKRV